MKKQVTDEKLVELLIIHGGVKGAAVACGLTQRAIYARLKKPSFRAEYDERRQQTLDDATLQLADSVGDAVTLLRRTVKDGESPAALRLQAAEALLRHALRYTEMTDTLRRVAELERKLDNMEAANEE